MANYVSQVTLPSGSGYDIRELFPHIGNCTVAASAAAKTVTIGNFKLYTGAWVVVKFSNTNSAAVASLTLNVDGTGAKPIKYRNANLSSAGLLIANRYTYFVYDGTNYQIVGDFDTNSDTKVKVTANTTTKGYLIASTTSPNGTAVEGIADTGVYLGTTAGSLYATSFYENGTLLTNKYLPLSGGKMTGTIQGTYKNTHIALAGGGIGDYATLDHKNDINISSWNGVSISNGCPSVGTLDQVTFSVNARTGATQQRGNAILYSESGNSPALIFQRGNFTDSTLDWKIYNSSGALMMDSTVAGDTETWQNKFKVDGTGIWYGGTQVSLVGHTHDYAGSTTAGGPANSANVLNKNTRMDYGWDGVNYFNINGTAGNAAKVNDTPTTAWWHIMRFNNYNSSGYYTDLAIPFNATSLYYKRITSGSVQNGGWVKVLDSLNYTSYTYNATASRTANTVLAAPNGSAGAATFRKLVAADLPDSYLPLSGGTMTGAIAYNNATTRLNSLKNLTNDNVGTSATYFLTITNSWGKGGYTSVDKAKTVLGLGSAAYTASTAYLASTTKYAGSSSVGGAATSANKLNTNAGATNRPVYFSGGVPVQCDTPASGSWFKGVPLITTDGVMKFGKYIDFHNTNGSTADYDYRMEITTATMTLHATGSSNTLTIKSPGNTQLSFQTTSSGKAYTASGITCYPSSAWGMTALFNFGGNLVIGGGESAKTLYDNNYDTIKTVENEDLYLCADHDIHIVTGCQTYDDKSIIDIDAVGKVYLPTTGSIILKQRSNSNYVSAVTWWNGGTAPGSGEYAPQIGQHNIGGDSSYPGSICILPYKSTTNPWGGNVGLFIRKDHVYIDGVELSKSTHTHKYAGSSSPGGPANSATHAEYVNVVAGNEIRFYNDNQLKANNQFWIGYSWADGSHYTPSGGSDTSSTTAPNITKFIMGNCSQGGLASVHAKTFILGNGSSPTHNSKTTTIATAATTTDRTITLPDASGTIAVFPAARTSGQVVVTDGTAGGVKSSGYTIATSVPSGAVFTDSKVTQTAVGSTYTNYRPIVISGANSATKGFSPSTTTDGTFITSSLYCQPSSGMLHANIFEAGKPKTADGAAKGQLKFFSGNSSDATGTVTLECVNDATRTGDYTVKLPTWNGTIPVFEKLFDGALSTVSLSYSDINEYDLFLITVANNNGTSEQVTVTSLWISNVVGVHDMPLIWGGAPSSSGGACNVTSGWIQLSKNSGTTTFSVAHKSNVAQMTSSGWSISSPTYNLYIRKIFGLKAYKRV